MSEPASSVADLYAEWQRPWFTALYAGVALGALGAVAVGIAVALRGPFYPRGAILIASVAVFGVFLALVSTRRIRLNSEALRVGRKWIPLRAVTQTGILHGRDLWRVRHRLVMPGNNKAPLLLGSATPGIGDAFAGGYLKATRQIRAGNCCSPGQGPAVVLLTPSLLTPAWMSRQSPR